MQFTFRNEVIEQLERLASEEYQKKEWTENVQKTWFFPNEIISQWFDDAKANDGAVLAREFSAVEITNLEKVTEALEKFEEQYAKESSSLGTDLREYSPWVEVRHVAQIALKVIVQS